MAKYLTTSGQPTDDPSEFVRDWRAGARRCEDYPCCGHGPEGCEDRPEFTADYWQGVYARREAQGIDWDDPMYDEP